MGNRRGRIDRGEYEFYIETCCIYILIISHSGVQVWVFDILWGLRLLFAFSSEKSFFLRISLLHFSHNFYQSLGQMKINEN